MNNHLQEAKPAAGARTTGVEIAFACILTNAAFSYGTIYNDSIVRIIGILLLLSFSLYFDPRSLCMYFTSLVPNQRAITAPDFENSLVGLIPFILITKVPLGDIVRHVSSSQNKTMMIMLLYALVMTVYWGDLSNSLLALKAVSIFTLYVFAVKEHAKNQKFPVDIALAWCIGSITPSLFAALNGGFNDAGRLQGVGDTSANFTAASLSISLSMITLCLISRSISVFSFIAIAIFIVPLGLMTESRSFAICVTVVLVAGLAFSGKSKGTTAILAAFTLMILACALFYLFAEQRFDSIVLSVWERLSNPRNGDISNGRIDLWTSYQEYFLSNTSYLIWGAGGQNAAEATGIPIAAHNGIIETVFHWGLIGTAVVFWCIGKTIAQEYRGKSPATLLPLAIILGICMSGHNIFNLFYLSSLFSTIAIMQAVPFANQSSEGQRCA